MQKKPYILITLLVIFFHATVIAAPTITSTPITTMNGSALYNYGIFANDSADITISLPLKPDWLDLSSDAAWYTSTFAGGQGTVGFVDGAAEIARFKNMYGVAIDSNGDIFIADTHNHAIRHIDGLSGEVTTVAGKGASGYADGFGSNALFYFPQGIDIDSNDDIYVADAFNHCIRHIDAATWEVSSIAGNCTVPGMANGVGDNARFFQPKGIAVDGNGDIWVADSGNHQIRFVTGNTVTTVAGAENGSSGALNGIGTNASFNSPRGMTFDPTGDLIIADKDNHLIRKLNSTTLAVTTIAGSGSAGNKDGIGEAADLFHPFDIASDTSGNLFFPDSSNHLIKRIDALTNVVRTISGDGTASFSDGAGVDAKFFFPRSIAIADNENLFVADRTNGSVRELAVVDAFLTGSANSLGDYPVTIRATSTNGSTDQSFTINVTAINTRPTIEGSPAGIVFENQAYSFIPTALDEDDDEIVYSVSMLPSWANFNESTGEVSGTPGFTDAKMNVHVAITADDQTGTDNATITLAPFNILVRNTNQAPVISGEPTENIEIQKRYSFIPEFSDGDIENALSLSVENLPTWADFNETTGEISGTPLEDDIGRYENIVITIDDNDFAQNSVSTLTFSVEVIEKINDAEGSNVAVTESKNLGGGILITIIIFFACLRRRLYC